MAGLVPAIHVLPRMQKDVDARLRGAFAGMTSYGVKLAAKSRHSGFIW